MNNIKWILKQRSVVIFLSLLFVCLAGAGALHIEKSSNYRIYFDDNDPLLLANKALEDTYIKDDKVLIVLAPDNGKVFTKEMLTMAKELTEIAWKIPYSIRVDSITNFQHSYAEEDDIIIEDLVENPESLSESELQALRETALNEPLLVKKLISLQAHVTGIQVTVQYSDNQEQEMLEIVAYVRALAEKTRAEHPSIKIYLTGSVFMNHAFPEASKKDMETLIPAMFVLIIILLVVLLKKWQAVVTTVLVFAFSIIATMGLAGWLGIKLSPAVASAPLIILTLAVADSVHILISYHYFLSHKNLERKEAISEAIRINFQPIFLTSFTTAIGFLSMNFSDSPPFRDLGNMTAVGVAVAFTLSVVLLPALVMVFPACTPEMKESSKQAWISALAKAVIRYQRQFLFGMSALIIVLIAFIPNNRLDEQFTQYFDKSMDFRQASDFASENLTGVEYFDYSFSAGQSDGINNPKFLQKIEDFANWYRQQPEVLHVTSITDTIKRLNRNMHGDDEAWYRLPEERELTAQYLLFYEMSLPFGLDLNDRLNVDKSATRLSVTLSDISTEEQQALEERAQTWLKTNAPTLQTDGVGRTIMFAHIAKNNIISMLNGTLLAILLISAIIIIAFRSLKIGILSLFCNIFPAAMAFGVWGIVSGRIGMAASVIVAITLGIVVDDTIHFLSKYLRARKEQQLTPEEAVRYTFSNVGMALSVTSIILFSGFLLLSFSTFQVNATLGLLVAITIVLALAVDFLFLPPLLIEMEQRKSIDNL